MTHPTTLSISNAYARQTLSAARQVLDLKQLDRALTQAGLERLVGVSLPDDGSTALSAQEYARLIQAMVATVSQPRAARPLLRQIGKAWFEQLLRMQPVLFNLAQPTIGLLPSEQRIRFILESWVTAITKTIPGAEAWLERTDLEIIYVEHTCPACTSRKSDQPVCHLTEGVLAAAVEWATGKKHAVTETECRAVGADSCRFVIDLAPLD